MNIPNVLQTDLVYSILRAVEAARLHGAPLWARPELRGEALIGEFHRESRLIYRGIEGDLKKARLAAFQCLVSFACPADTAAQRFIT